MKTTVNTKAKNTLQLKSKDTLKEFLQNTMVKKSKTNPAWFGKKHLESTPTRVLNF